MIVTLTTDFGYTDPFVGIMKGVIYSINPQAVIVDLTHGIPAQNILAGALVLSHSTSYFPRGTIHVAVVDPGVGSARKPVLIEAGGSFFIGPDNGIWSLTLAHVKPDRIIHLSNPIYHLKPTSTTFHGRDIFTPVAAHLSLGVAPAGFGEALESLTQIALPQVRRKAQEVHGEIVYIDGFGNLSTNIRDRDLEQISRERATVSLHNTAVKGIGRSYVEVPEGALTAVINSWGVLEIAANKGNAQQVIGAKLGDLVRIV